MDVIRGKGSYQWFHTAAISTHPMRYRSRTGEFKLRPSQRSRVVAQWQ